MRSGPGWVTAQDRSREDAGEWEAERRREEQEGGLPVKFQPITPCSPSRPARGCAVLASALRAALTAALRRDVAEAGNPAQIQTEDPIMNTLPVLSQYANTFEHGLTLDEVQMRAPAVFADHAHDRMSARYGFIPTQRVLQGLIDAGFNAVDARQARARRSSPLHARHLVRLRRRCETVTLRDSVPEVVCLNSHDGTSGYQMRMGLFRVICTNGMIVSNGAFPGYCVSHRGNVVEEVICAALELVSQFPLLACQVERMERRRLGMDEQVRLAERALALRYPDPSLAGMQPSQLLTCRRVEDTGDDLWRTLNRIQENLLRGGLSRRSAGGRLVRTRGITAIRQEVRINSALWDLALAALVA